MGSSCDEENCVEWSGNLGVRVDYYIIHSWEKGNGVSKAML